VRRIRDHTDDRAPRYHSVAHLDGEPDVFPQREEQVNL
jgi:hypothetical protein